MKMKCLFNTEFTMQETVLIAHPSARNMSYVLYRHGWFEFISLILEKDFSLQLPLYLHTIGFVRDFKFQYNVMIFITHFSRFFLINLSSKFWDIFWYRQKNQTVVGRQEKKNRFSGQNQLSLSRMYKKTGLHAEEIFICSCRNTIKICSAACKTSCHKSMQEGAGTDRRPQNGRASKPDNGKWLFYSPKRPYWMSMSHTLQSSKYVWHSLATIVPKYEIDHSSQVSTLRRRGNVLLPPPLPCLNSIKLTSAVS